MRLSNFKPGQTVYYVRKENHKPNSELIVKEYKVMSIGKKYIYACLPDNEPYARLYEQFYLNKPNDNFLTKKDTYWEHERLFLSEQDITDSIELEDLRLWIMNIGSSGHVSSYTLSQLRAVKKILCPGE